MGSGDIPWWAILILSQIISNFSVHVEKSHDFWHKKKMEHFPLEQVSQWMSQDAKCPWGLWNLWGKRGTSVWNAVTLRGKWSFLNNSPVWHPCGAPVLRAHGDRDATVVLVIGIRVAVTSDAQVVRPRGRYHEFRVPESKIVKPSWHGAIYFNNLQIL